MNNEYSSSTIGRNSSTRNCVFFSYHLEQWYCLFDYNCVAKKERVSLFLFTNLYTIEFA